MVCLPTPSHWSLKWQLTTCRFFNHQWPESRDDQRSSLNKEEAAMIVGFVTHLYRNGLALEHITSE